MKMKMFIFKDFGHKFTIFKEKDFFRIITFSEHLLPTACEYSMVLLLTKIKNQNKVISDKKSVLNVKSKSKLVKL